MQETKDNSKLIAALAKIMGELDRIPKNGYNAFHKYAYAMEADILDAVRQKLSAAGILLTSSVVELKTDPIGEKGSLLTTIRTRHTLQGLGGEVIFDGAGQGVDSGDKGVYKAITGELKYAILKNFLIPTGDDPEDDSKGTGIPKRSTNAPSGSRPSGRPSPKAAGKPTASHSTPPKQPAPSASLTTVSDFFKEVDKLTEAGVDENYYKKFFVVPAGKAVPALEEIAQWTEAKKLEYLAKVVEKMRAETQPEGGVEM